MPELYIVNDICYAGELQGRGFAPLADEKVFQNPTLFHGVITWKNGEIDIAPETVYQDSYPYVEE